jgi:ADP-ribosylglycohydrolase
LKIHYLHLGKAEIEIEHLQCEQEGRDLAPVEEDFDRLFNTDEDTPSFQAQAEALLDRTTTLPLRPDYPYQEPSDLEGIRAARPATRPALSPRIGSGVDLEDKVYGAWTGRCIGCLLGKPVEGWHRERMWGYLKELGRWPLSDFFYFHLTTPEMRQRLQIHDNASFAEHITAMPEDDDLNYTMAGLIILQRYGPQFAPENVAEFWLGHLPILHTFTAERVAYRNLVNGIPPPLSACFRNPFREWIGAQIRADFWGYAAPGNPERAAEFAWRDACISHVKNGIYGEMWAAAMIAAAFATDNIRTILAAGLAQIPAKCRLAEAIESVIEWQDVGVDYDTAVYRLHELWNEKRGHDWCHTISNAMVVTIGLLYGEGDFVKSICRAVQPCFDTDCNGATVGSILGIIHGRKALPNKWVNIIQDTLLTGVTGHHAVHLADITRKSLQVMERVATTA